MGLLPGAGSLRLGLGRRYWRAGGVFGVLGIVALLAGFVMHAGLDPDESQHLHIAWRVAQGQVPFVDFWEHHMPLLAYVLAPLTRWFADSPAVYFAARAIMAVMVLGSLGFVYVIARRLGVEVGVAAVLLLAVQFRFLQFSTQVRPDGPALLAWLATVWALVRWREGGRGWVWAAGLSLGFAATLTPKAAYVGLGAAGTVVAACWSSPRALAKSGAALARLVGGGAIPLGLLLAWLAVTGGAPALRGFVDQIVVANLRFPVFAKLLPFGTEGAGFTVLCLVGIVIALRRHGRHILQHPVHGPVLIPLGVVTAILLLPTTPAVNQYTWLPVVVGGSVYAALALVAAVEHLRIRRGRVAMAVVVVAMVAGVLVPAAVSSGVAFRQRTHRVLDRTRVVLAYACPGEAVIAGIPWYVFRPSALRYFFLYRGLRTWLNDGVISPQVLLDDLHTARAPVGVVDRPLRQAGAPIMGFLGKYYVRDDSERVLLAGARLTVPEGPGETAVDLLVPGLYRVTLSPGLDAALDGAVMRSPLVDLHAGLHLISWGDAPGTIQLVVASCAERQLFSRSRSRRATAAPTRRRAARRGSSG